MSQASGNSKVVAALKQLGERFETALARSRLDSAGRALEGFGERLGTALDRSKLHSAGRTLGRWTRSSYLYRWLTAEPDPDVIVIDLRETYTVGPILAGLDRAGRYVSNTRAGTAAAEALGSLSAEVERRPVRVASLVVLVALLVNTLVTLAVGGFSRMGLAFRLFVFGTALLGTQSSMTAAELAETRLWKLLEPPTESEPAQNERQGEETDGHEADEAAAKTQD